MTPSAALAVVVDRTQDPEVRRVAALIVGLLLRRAEWTERTAAEVSIALASTTDCAQAALVLVGLLLRRAPEPAKAAAAIARVAERAHREGHHATMFALVVRLLRHREGVLLVTPARAASAFEWARDRGHVRRAATLLNAWVDHRGASGAWVREAVETTPFLIQSEGLPVARRQQLHAAAPTVLGWHTFGSGAEHAGLFWSADCFGSAIDDARQTLEHAMAETSPARRVRLAAFLVQIAG